jgi:hypothetical protein
LFIFYVLNFIFQLL